MVFLCNVRGIYDVTYYSFSLIVLIPSYFRFDYVFDENERLHFQGLLLFYLVSHVWNRVPFRPYCWINVDDARSTTIRNLVA